MNGSRQEHDRDFIKETDYRAWFRPVECCATCRHFRFVKPNPRCGLAQEECDTVLFVDYGKCKRFELMHASQAPVVSKGGAE